MIKKNQFLVKIVSMRMEISPDTINEIRQISIVILIA